MKEDTTGSGESLASSRFESALMIGAEGGLLLGEEGVKNGGSISPISSNCTTGKLNVIFQRYLISLNIICFHVDLKLPN